MPPTSIFISAASAGTSGMGYSRISVLLGPVRTAANTVSATFPRPSVVMARHSGPTCGRHKRRLVPAIHVLFTVYKDVDARHKVYPWVGRKAEPEGRA